MNPSVQSLYSSIVSSICRPCVGRSCPHHRSLRGQWTPCLRPICSLKTRHSALVSIEEVATSDGVVSASASLPSTEAEGRVVSEVKLKRPRGPPKTSQTEEQRKERTKALNVMVANRYRRRKKETITSHNRLQVEKKTNEWLRKTVAEQLDKQRLIASLHPLMPQM